MDRSIFRWFNRLADHTGWAHGFFRFYANAGIVVLGALLIAACFEARHRDRRQDLATALWAGVGAFIALGLAQVIGAAIDRLRPYETMADVHVMVARTTDFSIPSDHATVSGAIAAGLLITGSRWGRPAAAAAVLMAFTRVYVGAHYLSDVLAGLALGAIVVVAGSYVVVPLFRKLIDRLSDTALRPLLTAAPRN